MRYISTVEHMPTNQVLKRLEIAQEKLIALFQPNFDSNLAKKICLALTYPYPFTSIAPWVKRNIIPEETKLEFGISEFSLSILPFSKPVEMRCLAEVISLSALTEETILQALGVVKNVFELLSDESMLVYDFKSYSDIYHIAYPLSGKFDINQKFHMGLALGFKSGMPINLKAYFDLLSEGKERANDKVKDIFDYLSLPGYDKLMELSYSMWDEPVFRGVGMDFSPDKGKNIRIYIPQQHFNQNELIRLLAESNLGDSITFLDMFNRIMLNGVNELQNRPTYISIIFSEHLPNQPIIKFDLFLPPWYPNDSDCFSAIHQLLSGLKLDPCIYDNAVRVLAGDQYLERLSFLHQYISIDFIPNVRLPKINIYLRPIGLETPSMDPRYYPRIASRSRLEEQRDLAVQRVITFLEAQRATGFAELKHRMIFPKKYGFSASNEYHEGLVFQLSIVCDALLRAKQAGFIVDEAGLISDIQKIVDARCIKDCVGWKYFPTLYELPPDADDLGQILQVLVQSKWDCISELCDPAIELLLEQGSNPDGSLETWIVDKSDTSPHTIAMLNAISNSWRDSQDVEVIANILYGLYLYNPKKFEYNIKNGIEFIAKMQNPEGFWNSTWYCGQLYGTYVSSRLIGAVNPSHPALFNVASFLTDQTKSSKMDNPTDVALGLLTSSVLVRCGIKFNKIMIERAIKYILNNQLNDGSWNASPFIQMDTNRALSLIGLAQPNIITYGSSTLASAFCLKALADCSQINQI